MSKAMLYQTSFNRGELDPALAGRADWEAYFAGAKTVRNLIVRPQGGVVKRGGSEFVALALEQEKPSLLVRFQFSAEQVYLLEFGDLRFRVFKDGGALLYPEGEELAGQEVVLPSPFPAADLAGLRHTQMEDVMVFAHPLHSPRRLIRHSHYDWRFSNLALSEDLPGPGGLYLTLTGGNQARYVVTAKIGDEETLPSATVAAAPTGGMTAPDPAGSFSSQYDWLIANGGTPPGWLNFNAMTGDQMQAFCRSCGIQDVWLGTQVSGNNVTWHYVYPGETPPANWDYPHRTVTWQRYGPYTNLIALCKLCCENGWAPGARQDLINAIDAFVANYNASLPSDSHNTLAWDALDGADSYRVWRAPAGAAGTFKLLGATAETAFDDDGLTALATSLPERGSTPFSSPGDYPGVCLFYQQRLILARSDNRPGTVWGSRLGSYRDFVRLDGMEITDSSPFEFDIYGVGGIDWAVGMSGVLLGTASGEWLLGGGGEVLSALNVAAVRQSNYGCGKLQPAVIGDAVMGVGLQAKSLRAYRWDFSSGGYIGKSISHYAGHLFRRRSIVGLAYQGEPESLLWTVMSDGSLLSCVYMSDEEVLGWSRHDSDGRFEALVNLESIEGQAEIWLLAAREAGGTVRRSIERLKPPLEEGEPVQDGWYVDSGLARNGEPTAVLGGLEHLEGKRVACLGDGNVYENLLVADGQITLPEEVRQAVAGLPYTAELETLELEPLDGGRLAGQPRRPVTASVLFYHSRDCRYGWPRKNWPVEFWNDTAQRPTPARTVRKALSIPAPPEGLAGSVWLSAALPLPFGVLTLGVQMEVGFLAPNPGRRR